MRKFFTVFVAMLIVLGLSSAAPAGDRQWVFDVYLEDDPLGSQSFRIVNDGDVERVQIEASLEYKILFFSLYNYSHRNEERWQDGCLIEINSTTDDNGDEFRLRGEADAERFSIETQDGRNEIEGCIRSFAYWNPNYLGAGRLLNSQTGEYESTTLTLVGEEFVEVKGARTPAKRYALESENFRIDLWYSLDDDWLALQSGSRGGRTLRYVRAN